MVADGRLNPLDREERYRRAKEILGGAGWLFDEVVTAEKAAWLATKTDEAERREQHWLRARMSLELKVRLESEVSNFEFDKKQAEKKQERRNARVRKTV